MSAHPWNCTRCTAVVFIPEGRGIEGGVCTQQARGCKGEIERMSEDEARGLREAMAARGMLEQAWLTLVFTGVNEAS